jgi:hypothetical protein
MYKKVISASLVMAAVMFSGCGNEDTTCRIDVQNAIDKGEYDTAIADLKGKCATAFNSSDLNMNLASAYMGKSGYSVSDIADMLINSDDNGGDAFSSFISSVDTKRKPDSLPLLTEASKYFTNAIARNGVTKASVICSASRLNLLNDSRVTNACLYIGFNETIKAANTITYLTGDVNNLVDSINSDSNTTPNDMRASLDALAWVIDASYTPKSDTNISVNDVNISGYSYANVQVTYTNNGQSDTFYRLARTTTREANNTTVITDGYCDENGDRNVCEGIEKDDGSIDLSKRASALCYACPVVMGDDNTLGIADLLVDTLNGGADAISAVSNDPDITSSIADFKEEITGSRDGNVTIQNIIDYLQK